MTAIIIIPARMESNRVSNKPLVEVNGKALLEYVFHRASRTIADNVLVTSPNREVIEFCESRNIPAYPSSAGGCPTGTHRCAEVVARMKRKFDVVINWQCDEVMADPGDVDKLIADLQTQVESDPFSAAISTLYAETDTDLIRDNSSRVKVRIADRPVFDERMQVENLVIACLDFSRSYIPGAKEHVGIYGYVWDVLQKLGTWKPSALARLESLEQLTWLEVGMVIRGVQIEEAPLAINTESDLIEFRRMMSDGK